MYIAWDIETCPLPLDSFTEAQQYRYEQQLAAGNVSDAEAEDEISRKARSLHPMLGWICCLSVAATYDPGQSRRVRSYTASTPADERSLLESFWNDAARIGKRNVTWITFNGKRFDAEFLLTRTLRHGLLPLRSDLLDQYPYSHTPHCDLLTVWRRAAMRLEDVCELLGVESPKRDLNGGAVFAAIEAGDIEAVTHYCEADVKATLACYARMFPMLGRSTTPRVSAGSNNKAALSRAALT